MKNKLNRIISMFLATVMVLAIVPNTALAAVPTEPSFEVKYEIRLTNTISDDGVLLFSKKPEQILIGEQYYRKEAYVFPTGTKVAQKMDGELVPIFVKTETAIKNGRFGDNNEAYELTLEVSYGDESGVRICSTHEGRGLRTVYISGENASEKPSFEVKFHLVEDGNGARGVLVFSEEPVDTMGAHPSVLGFNAYYVFPVGTKLAYIVDGALVPLAAIGMTSYQTAGGGLLVFAKDVFELTLTEEMGTDVNGVLIAESVITDSAKLNHLWKRFVIAGTDAHEGSEEFQKVYQWNTEIYNTWSSDAATLAYYLQPSYKIQSDNQTIIDLSKSIIAGISSDYERASAINVWVSENIWYDYDVYADRVPRTENSALSTLADKRGVCEGYTTLTIALLRASGIPAKAVYGLTRQQNDLMFDHVFYDFSNPLDMDFVNDLSAEEEKSWHVWAEAYIDGKWVIMDTTWDSYNSYENGVYSRQRTGGLIGKIYFDISVKHLSVDHRIADYSDYSPQMQEIFLDLQRIVTDLDENLSTASDWARYGIQSALDKGFIPDDLQNSYTTVITRQEFCRTAVKFVEYKTGKTIDEVLTERNLSRNTNTFTDTCDPDILAAYALGITSGTSASTFMPDGQFSREQAAAMLMNTCKVIGMEIGDTKATAFKATEFSDSDSISPWAVTGINFCFDSGTMNGTGNNNFNPKGTYTRQEAIVTFDRIK